MFVIESASGKAMCSAENVWGDGRNGKPVGVMLGHFLNLWMTLLINEMGRLASALPGSLGFSTAVPVKML